jgi:hypothetical protein
MAFAEHDDVIDAFAAHRADEALDISVLRRRPMRAAPGLLMSARLFFISFQMIRERFR